jgi:hypothetical protein
MITVNFTEEEAKNAIRCITATTKELKYLIENYKNFGEENTKNAKDARREMKFFRNLKQTLEEQLAPKEEVIPQEG